MSAQLSVEIETEGTVVARGVVDAHTADSLSEGLDAADNGGDVVVDLSSVDFMDSSGLRVVILAHRRLAAEGRTLRFRAVSEPVNRLLEITGLLSHFQMDGAPSTTP